MESKPRSRLLCVPPIVVVVAFLAAALPLILTGTDNGRAFFDHLNYHEPMIIRFAEQMPSPDLSNYLSATTPGYHLTLAVASSVVSTKPAALQSVGALFTVALLVLFTRWTAPRAGVTHSTIFGLMLIASLYVFPAGVYLLPDNAAWVAVLAVLLIALRPKVDRFTLIAGGAALFYLILFRQSHLWTAGVLWAAAWIGDELSAPKNDPVSETRELLTKLPVRLKRLTLMLAACVPALLLLAYFVNLWGGLTVPLYHDYMQGINTATPVFILAQFGVISVFFAGYWAPRCLSLFKSAPWAPVLLVIVTLAVSFVPETTQSVDEGRYSGYWILAAKTPIIAGHASTAIVSLAALGSLFVLSLLASLGSRQRWIMLAALAAFTAALTVNEHSWQRYHEPFLLMWTSLAATLILSQGHSVHRIVYLARLAGPAFFFLILAAITTDGLRKDADPLPVPEQEAVSTPLRDLWPNSWDRIQGTPLQTPTDPEPIDMD